LGAADDYVSAMCRMLPFSPRVHSSYAKSSEVIYLSLELLSALSAPDESVELLTALSVPDVSQFLIRKRNSTLLSLKPPSVECTDAVPLFQLELPVVSTCAVSFEMKLPSSDLSLSLTPTSPFEYFNSASLSLGPSVESTCDTSTFLSLELFVAECTSTPSSSIELSAGCIGVTYLSCRSYLEPSECAIAACLSEHVFLKIISLSLLHTLVLNLQWSSCYLLLSRALALCHYQWSYCLLQSSALVQHLS
jgi:hypothetical protein